MRHPLQALSARLWTRATPTTRRPSRLAVLDLEERTVPANGFFQSFEVDNNSWNVFGGLHATRVPSGTNSITSLTGSFHATSAPSGAATNFGGYTSTFPVGGYRTVNYIYLDPTAPYTNDTRFDYISAVNTPGGVHRRDFVFNAGYYNDAGPVGSGPRFVISASNNASRGSSFPKNPSNDPFVISAPGWYGFEHSFRDAGGGVLAVDYVLRNASGTVLKTWTRSDPTDIIGSTVGGNRYGWVAFQEFASLAIDNSAQFASAAPTITYVDDNWVGLPFGLDPDGAGPAQAIGYDAFPTIQEGVTAVTTAGTVNVAEGNYPELVTVPKQVTILGAQAGIDARTRASAESVVNAAGLGGAFNISASDVVIDGFTIQGQTGGFPGAAVWMQPGTAGTVVRNNIIQNNVVGVFVANNSGSNQTVISQNLFRNNTNPGAASGSSIYADQFTAGTGVQNVLIDNNTFTNAAVTVNTWAIGISNTDPTPFTNFTITNNAISNHGRGLYLYNTDNSTITNNQILGVTNYAVGLFDGNDNIAIGNNRLESGNRGVWFGADFGNANTNVTVTNNSLAGNTTSTLQFDPASYTGTLNASANYWGTSNATTVSTLIVTPVGPVDFTPLLDNNESVANQLVVGFQPDLTSVTVHTLGAQTGAIGRIQEGITTTSVGGIVNVTAGTFAENIVLNKQLTLRGSQVGVDARGRVVGAPNPAVETVVAPASGIVLDMQTNSNASTIDGFAFVGSLSGATGAVGNTSGTNTNLQFVNNYVGVAAGFTASALFMNRPAVEATFDRNEFVTPAASSQTVFFDGADAFHGLYFTNNNVLRTGLGGTGLFVDGNRNVGTTGGVRSPLVQGNLFQGHTLGFNAGQRSFANTTFAENTFTGNTGGFAGGPLTSSIVRNSFTSNSLYGLRLTSFGNTTDPTRGAQSTTVSNNIFSGNGTTVDLVNGYGDIRIDDQFNGTQATNTISNNSLSGPSFIFNRESNPEVINVSGNWFGSATLATISAGVLGVAAGNVDYTPYLNTGLDTNLVTPGFQGDYSNLTVHAAGAQAGATPRLQEGYDLLTSTGTIHILSGAYTGNVDYGAVPDKAVTVVLGSSPGQVTINGDLTLTSNDTLDLEIDGTLATQYDNLTVSGNVTLGNATLALSGSYVPASGHVFTIIDKTSAGSIAGTFAGYPEGATVTDSPFTAIDSAIIRYTSGVDSNNVTLTTNSYPVLNPDAAEVHVPEGSLLVANTGTVSDADGDTVALSASIGTVINNGDGTWSWSHNSPLSDGDAGPFNVIITGDDGRGGISTTAFDYYVDNVDPTATVPNPFPSGTIVRNTPYQFDVNTITDPAVNNDTYTITWDWDGDGLLDPEDFTQSGYTHGASDFRVYDFPTVGSYTVKVTVNDEDGGSTTYNFPVTVAVVVLQPDGYLHVGGTDGDNTFTYDPDPAVPGNVRVFVDGVYYGSYAPANGIRTFAGDGDDRVRILGTTGDDVFEVGADVTPDLEQDKVFNLNGLEFTTLEAEHYVLEAGAGNDGFLISGLGNSSTTEDVSLIGGNGVDVITSNLTTADVGAETNWLVEGPERGIIEGIMRFNTMSALVGNDLDDNFKFLGGASMPGTTTLAGINGDDGSNTFDLSSSLAATVFLVQANGDLSTSVSKATDIDTLIGSSATSADRLVAAPGLDTTWNITNPNEGDMTTTNGTLTFTSIESLTGASGAADSFTFAATGLLTGALDASTGADIVDLSARPGNLSATLSPATLKDGTTNLVSSWQGVETLIGNNANNTLTAANALNVWTIDGDKDGTLNALAFENFGNLVGGTSTDTFAFLTGGLVTTLNGNGASGTNKIDVSGQATPLTVTLVASLVNGTATPFVTGGFTSLNSFVGSPSNGDSLTAPNLTNTINITGVGKGTLSTTVFDGMESVVGGTGNDTITVTTLLANPLTSISGGLGNDTLRGPATTSSFAINGPGSGLLGTTMAFAEIENLTGNTGADTFTMGASGALNGNLDGGSGTDTLDIVAAGAAGFVNLQTKKATGIGVGQVLSIEKFVGNDATLTGANSTNTWRLTGLDAGTLNVSTTFNGFASLIGGTSQDRLQPYQGNLSGGFNGMAGTDILDYSGVVGMTRPYTPTILGFTGLVRSGTGGNVDELSITQMESLTGNL